MNCLWRSAAFMPIFRSTERMSLIVIRKTEDLAMQINGLHHVTAISGPARRNLDFYARVLGLRLVKKTVNFDDPGTYHLYFGDVDAAPGSILTFFPWEHASPGRLGVGETQETVFRVPEGSIGFWAHRFVEQGVPHEVPVKRFGETVLSFRDPDGMRLALVGLPVSEHQARRAALGQQPRRRLADSLRGPRDNGNLAGKLGGGILSHVGTQIL